MKKYNGFTHFVKRGFTLAETLIVVTVLGIIAILTVPNLVNKNKTSVSKTRVKKAMAAYESALNKMVMENGIRNDNVLTKWANQNPNCENTSAYFKIAEGNGCVFKTTDGIWWDISDIQRPIIAFRQEDLTTVKANDANDMTAFVMVGRFDDNNSLRIDDLLYETNNSVKDAGNNESSAQVAKLYGFINPNANGGAGGNADNANAGNDNQCADWNTYCKLQRGDYSSYTECVGEHRGCYVSDHWTDYLSSTQVNPGGYVREKTRYFYYDEDGNYLGEFSIDENGNKGCSQMPLNDGSGRKISQEKYADGSIEYEWFRTNSAEIETHYYKDENNGLGDVKINGGNYNGVNVIFTQDGTSCSGNKQGHTCEEIKGYISSVRNEFEL